MVERVLWYVSSVNIIDTQKCSVGVLGRSLSIANQTTFSHSFQFPLKLIIEKNVLPRQSYCGTCGDIKQIFFNQPATKEMERSADELQHLRR